MEEMRSYQVTEWDKPLQLRLRERPEPKGAEVLVKIEACGVCHSDVHIGEGYFEMGHGRKARLEDTGAKLPLTMGHEIAGTVVAMGPDAKGTSVGVRGVVYPWIGCGHCAHCLRGHDVDCETPRSLGVRADGGYSNYVLVPDGRYVVPIDGVDLNLAATYACSSLTAYSALKKLPPLLPEDRVLVIGAGGLGLAAVSLAPLLTAGRVIVADIEPVNLAAAQRQGASMTFDSRTPEPAKALKEAAGGSFRAVIDFVGSTDTAQLAMGVVAKGATIVIVGLHGGSIEVPLPLLPSRNLTLRGSYVGSVEDLQALLKLAREKKLAPIPLATRPLADINAILDDLRKHRVVGRVVTVP